MSLLLAGQLVSILVFQFAVCVFPFFWQGVWNNWTLITCDKLMSLRPNMPC